MGIPFLRQAQGKGCAVSPTVHTVAASHFPNNIRIAATYGRQGDSNFRYASAGDSNNDALDTSEIG
jgi:hypothetical protein